MFQPKGIVCKDIDTLLKHIADNYEIVSKVEYHKKKRRVIKYINIPSAFDSEASSFTIVGIKCSCMYIWQIGINGYACYGRTWEQYEDAMSKIKKHFNLDLYTRLPMYVHNLSYDFQFIRTHHEIYSIFAREKRCPMKVVTKEGFEFRCSYVLSGASLEQTCKDLQKYKIAKKVGDLDYSLLRTPVTKLSQTEIDYCMYDVFCVMNYIKEEMERYDNNVTKIPMTKTGKVRKRCREHCFNKKNKARYKKIISGLQINDLEEYNYLKRAFQGGFTHASWLNVYFVHYKVHSFDFTSSYPTVLCCEEYPMGKGEYIKIIDEADLENRAKTHLLVFNVHITGLKPKFKYEHYLSASKCWVWNSEGLPTYLNEKNKSCRCDNGRLIEADEINTTITNVDWEIIKQCYEWDGIDFGHGYQYIKGYLPKEFVEIILDLYKKKTEWKDIEEFAAEYLLAKGDVNSMYGMTVTDIINSVISFIDGEWQECDGDIDKQIDDYNKSRTRFLFYPWGVFCTAYARRNLWTGILELGEDYIYSDTDSVKFLNYEKHKNYFENYNKWIIMKLEEACKYHGIDPEMVRPKTVKGKSKPLGVWDDEGVDTPEGHIYARRFKTLGAKRYLIEGWKSEEEKEILDDEGNPTGEKEIIPAHWELKCTIAGVNKKLTSKWFNNDYDNAFDKFKDYMEVPEEYSGRLIATYIDPEDAIEADVTDYQGNVWHMTKNPGIHLGKSSYNLTMTPIYMALLNGREEQQSC